MRVRIVELHPDDGHYPGNKYTPSLIGATGVFIEDTPHNIKYEGFTSGNFLSDVHKISPNFYFAYVKVEEIKDDSTKEASPAP